MIKQIGIDLGSANTLIYLKDTGIILSAPTVISIDKNTGKDLCFGSAAKRMLGKTPKHIKVSRPVREGVIADMDDTTLLISRLLDKTELVSEYIMNKLGHGVTVTDAVGAYTQTKKGMIHTVCRRYEAIKLRAAIKQIDENAFIVITTSSEIIGKGFRNI